MLYSHHRRSGYQRHPGARERLSVYFTFYNRQRGHQALDYRTPNEVYFAGRVDEFALAA